MSGLAIEWYKLDGQLGHQKECRSPGASSRRIFFLEIGPGKFPGVTLNPPIIPEGLRQLYDQYSYLCRKQVKVVAQRDGNVLKLLESWEESLKEAGWNTWAVYADDASFSFAFQSHWQKTMMIRHGSNMLMLNATHNLTNNYFLYNGKKISLWTFLIRDPIVGKGLPVAWAFTASASSTHPDHPTPNSRSHPLPPSTTGRRLRPPAGL
ncbi:hypothetical protein PCANC_09612 [Puccinia coronata f. sp. avenae]|uniref:Uncharacterized protein n=1 Tax=Puccinia coronata f. sp. avenae TaxID=200324 RepID=A0A2N5V1M9_9BASI|nr:hypothetical protein PCANC_09612 [Puccinia coronata f. sp. avenae]